MNVLKFYIIAFSLMGCATYEPVSLKPDLVYEDDTKNEKINLTYVNRNDKSVCFSTGDWPNAAGELNQSSDLVFLEVEDRVFPIAEDNLGYCIGSICAIKVKSKESISATFPYSIFGLDKDLYSKPKTLIYDPPAEICTN